MQWRFWNSDERLTSAEVARALHSQWLTKALASRREYPRIPIRRAAEGGFSKMLDRPGGPDRARQWWDTALDRLE